VILGNEVLDAMPADVIRVRAGGAIEEAGVAAPHGRLGWSYRPAPADLARDALALGLPEGYRTELQRAAGAFVRSVGDILERGIAIFIDYGFPAREYYHAQRSDGTLMCHYRHHAHQDPFFLPGLQDITTHIDFSAVARAAGEAGLELAGFTSQAQFLINCGITEVLSRTAPENAAAFLPLSGQVNRLTSPAEMGELFKVIAMARGFPAPLLGFSSGDRRAAL
jgi:SAM-dependent MidA family methyltransferase